MFGWFEDDSHSATAVARPHLEVVDAAVVGGSADPFYVVVVKNDDRRRAALGVTPRLTSKTERGHRVAKLAGSGAFEFPANVPPGGTAVAVDRLRATPAEPPGPPQFHVRGFRPTPKFPVKAVSARFDPVSCTLTARISASRRLSSLPLAGVARSGGRIVGGGFFRVAPVPRGRSDHELRPPSPRFCGEEPARWSLYPALTPSGGRWQTSMKETDRDFTSFLAVDLRKTSPLGR